MKFTIVDHYHTPRPNRPHLCIIFTWAPKWHLTRHVLRHYGTYFNESVYLTITI